VYICALTTPQLGPLLDSDPLSALARRVLHSNLAEALAHPHGIDRYIELVRPLQVKAEIRAEVTGVHHQTAKSVTLTLAPNENWPGLCAGQFVGVSVAIDGVRETRPYSPAGSQHERNGALELTVSTHPEGKVSRHLRDHAQPGMIVGLTAPQGQFVLADPRPERVLLISGGSGITPVMAMLRTLCDEGYSGEIGFLNYARSPQLALYGGELAQLARKHRSLHVARGFTQGRSSGLRGRFGRKHLRALGIDHRTAATYVCGPPTLIESVRALWAADGLKQPAVETFTAPVQPFETAGATGAVRFLASERVAANTGLPLLEQAEDAGLHPNYGCRMGICNTCATHKAQGTVRNVITGAISSACDEQIRLCVCVPVGDVALDL
jgi:ferredoxin-NADP reductase